MTCSISGASPSGWASGETTQSPSPAGRRAATPNQPSSSTNRSTPTAAARSASAFRRVEVVIEVHGLPRVEQHRARSSSDGWAATRRWRWNRRLAAREAASRGRRRARACRSVSPGSSDHLTGMQQLTRAAGSDARRASRSASRAWLPLHARCAPHTSPRHSPKPAVPANSSGGCSCDVRPRRFSLVNAPWPHATRIGCSSRVHRPRERAQLVGVRGHGERDGRAVEQERRRSPVLVSSTRASRNTSSRRNATSSASSATSSTASRRRGARPSRVCDSGRNRGAQSRRRGGDPISPGRPAKPMPCSGTTASGATTSSAAANDRSRQRAQRVEIDRRRPSRRPQWRIVGHAGRQVDDHVGVDAPRRWISTQPLLAPSVSPEMNCFCSAMYTISVAARS